MRMEKKARDLVKNGFRVGGYKFSFRFIPIMLGVLFVMILGIASFAQDRDGSGDGLNLKEMKETGATSTAQALDKVKTSLETTAEASEKTAAKSDKVSKADAGKMKAVAAKTEDAKESEKKKEETAEKTAEEAGESESNDGQVSSDTYIAGPEDTLWSIALNFGIDLDDLIAMNPEIDPEALQSGEVVYLTFRTGMETSEDSGGEYQDTYESGSSDVEVEEYEITLEESVPYETIYEETYDLASGQESVYIEGTNGRKFVTSWVREENGEIVSKDFIREEMIEEPTNRVVLLGIGEAQVSSSEESSESTAVEVREAPAQEAQEAPQETLQEQEEPVQEPQVAEVAEPEEVPESTGSGLGQAIVDAAYAQIGVQQTCTQLVTNSLRAAGINFAGSPSDYISLGNWTDNPVPGDICIYTSHVAIYIGDGMAIHGGWDGPGYSGSTQVWSVYVNWPPFIGYIHIGD